MQLTGIDIKIISDNNKRFDRGSNIKYCTIGIATQAHRHHKFAVIDDRIIITGCYNRTRSAETKNYENILVTDSKNVAETYTREFNKL